MNAEIIAVGTEILMGQIVNTNSAYLAQELAKLSIPTYYQQVVGDNEERMLDAIRLAASRSDLVILSGGLGPTTDDITKQMVAQYVGKTLVEDELALAKVVAYHEQSHRPMSDNNRRQALVFEEGVIFDNHNGLAVGCAVDYEDTCFIVLPGPPRELKTMMEREVIPYLNKRYEISMQFVSRYLRFFGIGESRLAADLSDLFDAQTNPTIAPYAGTYEVMLRLTANGNDEVECNRLLDELEATILGRVGEYFYGYGEYNSLLEVTSHLLKDSGLSIATAESLTGGLFSSTLVSQPGSSAYVKGGTVAYQKEAKIGQLHIDADLLETYGMVSPQCAEAMATHVRELYHSDLGISFTGVAGPDEMEGKEVGTVFVSLADADSVETHELHLARTRNGNREFTVQHGLNILREYLEKHGTNVRK